MVYLNIIKHKRNIFVFIYVILPNKQWLVINYNFSISFSYQCISSHLLSADPSVGKWRSVWDDHRNQYPFA